MAMTEPHDNAVQIDRRLRTDLQLTMNCLPEEMILFIVQHLEQDNFVRLAFAKYELLLKWSLVPKLTATHIHYLTDKVRTPSQFKRLGVPAELIVMIVRQLNRKDMMNFVIANYQDLAIYGIAPRLEAETIKLLEMTIRPSNVSSEHASIDQ